MLFVTGGCAKKYCGDIYQHVNNFKTNTAYRSLALGQDGQFQVGSACQQTHHTFHFLSPSLIMPKPKWCTRQFSLPEHLSVFETNDKTYE